LRFDENQVNFGNACLNLTTRKWFHMSEQDELTILITVLEEFAGSAMNELQSSDGVIIDLNANQGTIALSAKLASNRLNGLARAIALSTGGRGTVTPTKS
jgi:hypothetical protein